MTSLPQNACIYMIFLVYCFRPGNALELRSWLGCRLLIPCDDNGIAGSDSFKWFYKKDKRSEEIQLFFQKKSGLKLYHPNLPKIETMPNRSLIINRFADKDQGLYGCENCFQELCRKEPSNFIEVQKEIVHEIQKTVYIFSGSSFDQTCPGELLRFKWTFEASSGIQRTLEQRSETVTITNSKTLHIGPVRNTNAGKYTCWGSRCGEPNERLLTINLCVITVYSDAYALLSCNLTCDVGINYLKDNSSLLMSNRSISVHVDPAGFLICNLSQILDENITSATHDTSSTSDVTKKSKPFIPVIYALLVSFTFLILLAVIRFCLKSRIQAGRRGDCSNLFICDHQNIAENKRPTFR